MVASKNVHVGGKRPAISSLTGLRFFAAFFILFAHAMDWLVQFQGVNRPGYFAITAIYGMPLFFVLSGFVIHYNYSKLFRERAFGLALCEFASARVARLFPLYFFFLIVGVFADDFVAKVYGNPQLAAEIAVYFITLTQSWFYIVLDGRLLINWLFPLSWSISTELFFYLAYVPIALVIGRFGNWRIVAAIGLFYCLCVTAGFVVSAYGVETIIASAKRHFTNYVDMRDDFTNSFYRWFFYFSPYARLFEFVSGVITAHVLLLMSDRKISSLEHRFGLIILVTALLILALFGIVYAGIIVLQPLSGLINHLALNFLCAPALAAIIFCAGRYDTAFSRFLSLPFLVALGETSYSIYLVHAWSLRIFIHPAPPLTPTWAAEAAARVLVAIIFTLMIAYASYKLIEVPSRWRLRGIFGRWIATVTRGSRLVSGTRP